MTLMSAIEGEFLAVAESKPIVLTREGVREEWEEVRKIERAAAERRARFTHLAQYLVGVGNSDWVPSEAAPVGEHFKKGKPRAESGTWTSEILLIVEKEPDGVEMGRIRELLAKGVMAGKMLQNPNGFYNGVKRLEDLGNVVRYKGRVFTTEHMADFLARVERGEVAEPDGRAGSRTIIDMLADFINHRPEGMTAREMVRAMEEEGMASGSVYNNLSKAVNKNRIRREGNRYYPLKENEPPQDTGSGSETGGDAPTIEDQAAYKRLL